MSEQFFRDSAAIGTDSDSLEDRVAALERRLHSSRIFSDKFPTRAFAVWGHFFVGHIILMLAIGIPMAIISAFLSR